VAFFFDWQPEDSHETFRKKMQQSQGNRCNMGARKQYSSNNFHGRLIKDILLVLITNVHDFYTVLFGGTQSYSSIHCFLFFLFNR